MRAAASTREKREVVMRLETLEQLVSDVRNLTMKYHLHAMSLLHGVKDAKR